VPEGWTCRAQLYLNGICNCGCGIVDGDCNSALATACEDCWQGCAESSCPGPIDAANNAICTGVPVRWTCEARFFGDENTCDCGCGAPDVDCADGTLGSCERCDLDGSCSAQACPGTIAPENNALCEQVPPPDGWTCGSYRYADGYSCDCGCGVLDLDCATNDVDECDNCYQCGSYCPARVDPADPTQCLQPPEAWTCDSYLYSDGNQCDCGCGVRDPDCESALPSACENCPESYGSCSTWDCDDIWAEDNSRCSPPPPAEWTCNPNFYGDGDSCDCGCGAVDPDCSSANKSACQACPGMGQSCSPTNCSAINESNNAVCN
jgi:hypothetical protein